MTKLTHILLATSTLTTIILASPLPNPIHAVPSIQDSAQADDFPWGKSKRNAEETKYTQDIASSQAGDTPWGKPKRHLDEEISVASDTPWGKSKRDSEGQISARVAGGPYQSHRTAPSGSSGEAARRSKRDAPLDDSDFQVTGGPYHTHGGGESGDLDAEIAQAGDTPWGKTKRFAEGTQLKRDALDADGFQVSGGPYHTHGEGDLETEGWQGDAQRSRSRHRRDEDEGFRVSGNPWHGRAPQRRDDEVQASGGGNPWHGRHAGWSSAPFRARSSTGSGLSEKERREDVVVNGGPYQTHGVGSLERDVDLDGGPFKTTSAADDAKAAGGPYQGESKVWIQSDEVEGGPYHPDRKRQEIGAETSGQHQTHQSRQDDGATVSGGPYQAHSLRPEGI